MTISSDTGRDGNSNPPRATDAEDERWVGEGGGSSPSAHGAGNDDRDNCSDVVDAIDADDPHKVEKLTTLGSNKDSDEGSE